MKASKLGLILAMGLTVISFQNCSKVGLQVQDMAKLQGDDNVTAGIDVPDIDQPDLGDDSDDNAGIPKDVGPKDGGPKNSGTDNSCDDKFDDKSPTPPVAPLDATCKSMISSSTAIVYDSLAEAGSAERNYAIQVSNQDINYENVGKVSNGSAQSVVVKARSIAQVSNLSVSKVLLNAVSIGQMSNFSSSQVVAVARKIDAISNFSAKLCLSVQELSSLGNLSSDLTILGRGENGARAKVKTINHISALMSLHDVDVESIESGSIRLRAENVNIGSITSGSGTLYLINSKVESVSKFSGTIHLYGNSSVGSSVSSSVRLVQH